jgi:hypothetical protein
MHRLFISAISVILLAAACHTASVYGVTIKLRNGKKVSGEVVEKDDEKLVLKTADGEKTYTWRQLSSSSIKAVHPELYAELKQKAEQRMKEKEEDMKAKGLVKVGKKWVTPEEAAKLKFRKISLQVDTTETGGGFKKTGSDSLSKTYVQERHGVLKIMLDGLDPKQKYTLKTKYTLYLKVTGDMPIGTREELSDENEEEEEETIQGKRTYSVTYETKPYRRYKETLKSGIRYSSGGGKSKIAGYKSDGWKISILLNDTEIFTQVQDGNREYKYVEKD